MAVEEMVENIMSVYKKQLGVVADIFVLKRAIEEAILAGLKTKWHKPDEKDLPLVDSTVLNEDCDKVTYNGNGKWIAYSEYYEEYIEVETPKAWCEVPEYIEE